MSIDAMKQALDALELYQSKGSVQMFDDAVKVLRERLAQPEHDDPIGDAQDKLIAEQAAQPQMQPCAGRNCGSTNPNLHSAECFEDYERSTGMNQWQGLTDEEIAEVISGQFAERNYWVKITKALEAKLKEKNT